MSEYDELAVQKDEHYRRDLNAQIELGLDAEQFFHTKLGQYLEKRAMDSALEAMQSLKTCDPTDDKTIRALQNAVFRAESFVMWIDEAIKEGEIAVNQLQEQ